MKIITNDLHAISGGTCSQHRFSNSFIAGMKGDENFNAFYSNEAKACAMVGSVIGLVGFVGGSVPGVIIMAGSTIICGLLGAASASYEYNMGANYITAQTITNNLNQG